MEHILSKANRNYWMGLSILLVFFYHTLFPAWDGLSYKIFLSLFEKKSEVGVDIFLFVSAYGLCHSYCQRTLQKFYWFRFKRLFPIYIVFFLIFANFRSSVVIDNKLWCFIQQITGLACFTRSHVDWYVPSLIFLYLVFPLLFKSLKKLYNNHLSFLWLVLIVLTVCTFAIQQVLNIHLAKRLPTIALGVLTYLCEKKGDEKTLLSFYATVALASIFSPWHAYTPLLLYGFKYIPFNLPFSKTLSFLGKHTLEIYLAQHIAFRCYYIITPGSVLLRLPITLLITIVLAVVLWATQYYFWKVFDRKQIQ